MKKLFSNFALSICMLFSINFAIAQEEISDASEEVVQEELVQEVPQCSIMRFFIMVFKI